MDFDLADAARQSPLVVRGLVGLAALGLVLDGVRAYRVSLLLASFGAGAVGVLAGAQLASAAWSLSIAPWLLVIAAIAGGAAVALLARIAEVVCLVVVGGVCGLQLVVAVGGVAGVDPPWFASAIGAVVGAAVVPRIFRAVLKVVTPLVGAGLAAWALGRSDDLVLVGVVWVCGMVVQWRRGGAGRDGED